MAILKALGGYLVGMIAGALTVAIIGSIVELGGLLRRLFRG